MDRTEAFKDLLDPRVQCISHGFVGYNDPEMDEMIPHVEDDTLWGRIEIEIICKALRRKIRASRAAGGPKNERMEMRQVLKKLEHELRDI